MLPLISVISVNFNQIAVTLEMIHSLKKISYPNLEIIIVDNASKENPEKIVLTQFPDVKFIRSEQNLGFAGGNNVGMSIAQGKHILFLNNDTEVTPNFLEPLVKVLEENPKIAIVCPKIRYFHTPDTIQYAGSTPLKPYTVASFAYGSGQKDNGQFDQSGFTAIAHGAAMMVRKEVIEKVGKMPEFFFLYYEELDWCEQIKRAGYQIWYEASSMIYHKESISTQKGSPLQTFYKTRNRIWLARRNFNGFQKLIALNYLALVGLVRFFTLLKDSKQHQAHRKAIWEGFFTNWK